MIPPNFNNLISKISPLRSCDFLLHFSFPSTDKELPDINSIYDLLVLSLNVNLPSFDADFDSSLTGFYTPNYCKTGKLSFSTLVLTAGNQTQLFKIYNKQFVNGCLSLTRPRLQCEFYPISISDCRVVEKKDCSDKEYLDNRLKDIIKSVSSEVHSSESNNETIKYAESITRKVLKTPSFMNGFSLTDLVKSSLYSGDNLSSAIKSNFDIKNLSDIGFDYISFTNAPRFIFSDCVLTTDFYKPQLSVNDFIKIDFSLVYNSYIIDFRKLSPVKL